MHPWIHSWLKRFWGVLIATYCLLLLHSPCSRFPLSSFVTPVAKKRCHRKSLLTLLCIIRGWRLDSSFCPGKWYFFLCLLLTIDSPYELKISLEILTITVIKVFSAKLIMGSFFLLLYSQYIPYREPRRQSLNICWINKQRLTLWGADFFLLKNYPNFTFGREKRGNFSFPFIFGENGTSKVYLKMWPGRCWL